jgi:hypothetical protein
MRGGGMVGVADGRPAGARAAGAHVMDPARDGPFHHAAPELRRRVMHDAQRLGFFKGKDAHARPLAGEELCETFAI